MHFSDKNILFCLYYAFIRSKLEYAILIWYPNYECYRSLLESVQRKFLKYLWFKTYHIYPSQGTDYNVFLDIFNCISLNDRHTKIALDFLCNIINAIIDSPQLLQKFNFRVPRISSRLNSTFYLPLPKTNVLSNSPIYVMCNLYKC